MAVTARDLGSLVSRLRVCRGMTQRQLAERTKLTVNFISLVETGRRRLSFDALERVATAFRLPVELLLLFAGNGKVGRRECLRGNNMVVTAQYAALNYEPADKDLQEIGRWLDG